MKERNMSDENWAKNQQKSKILGGVLIITAGVLILLKQIGAAIPEWILSWEMILIAIGAVMLVKHNFKKTGAYILIFIGLAFMINDFYPDLFDVRFIWPILIIIIGISMVMKSGLFTSKKKETSMGREQFSDFSSEDFVNSAAFFSGINKKVMSKNFKGASISSVFGGNEINLSQADFNGQAVIDATCVFGGVTLIVPSHWKVKTDMTSVFGGIDDQRPAMRNDEVEETKTLLIKGTCVFGGIEIHSYN